MKQSKVLHVVRHAKSSWDYDGTADIDRSLKEKGIRNAYAVSRKLKLAGLVPQKMISSPANRALHTAVIFARVLGYNLSKLEINDGLYETSTGSIIDMIRDLDDEIGSVMIFGHNPGFTELVNSFIETPIDNLPTSGSVSLEFSSAGWKDISRGNLKKHIQNFPGSDD